MREILFRGKSVDNGKWLLGYYSEFPIPSLGCMLAAGTDEYITCEDTRSYIVKIITKQHPYFSNANPMQVWEYEKYEVIPKTVGQYTGLTDKNGKKVFEGDILDCNDRIVYVKWHKNYGCWDTEFIRYKGNLCSNGITAAEWKYRAEVIGNIHDNKELLEI